MASVLSSLKLNIVNVDCRLFLFVEKNPARNIDFRRCKVARILSLLVMSCNKSFNSVIIRWTLPGKSKCMLEAFQVDLRPEDNERCRLRSNTFP